MKKSRFSESQIVAIIKEVEMGTKIGETCRKHGESLRIEIDTSLPAARVMRP